MAEYTPCINLYKPNVNDEVDVHQSLSENFTKIDTTLAEMTLKSWVSVTDYGADPTGVIDSTNAIQQAVNEAKTIYFPKGNYLISNTIRESTNAGSRMLIGENQFETKIKASSSMMNKPMIWLGNSTGHANYYGKIENLTLNGYSKANNNIGIRWHEAGTSITRDVTISYCGMAIQALGSIHNKVEGNMYVNDCVKGIAFLQVEPGTPSSLDDITTTAHPISLTTNVSKIVNVWFSNVEEEVIRVEGGLCKIEGCTFQASPSKSGNHDAVTLIDANEAYDYGGGSVVEDCWFEQLKGRYAIAVRHSRACRIIGNFISGNDPYPNEMEGGILLDQADNVVVKYNSIRGLFTKPPTEGRTGNGAVYVDSSTRTYTCDISENYMTKNTCNYYFEGNNKPSYEKIRKPHWIAVSINAGLPTIVEESDDFVLTVARFQPGVWTVQYKYNRPTETIYPVQVTPYVLGGTADAYSWSVYQQDTNYDRIAFKNSTGTLTDPAGFVLYMYTNTNSI